MGQQQKWKETAEKNANVYVDHKQIKELEQKQVKINN